VHADVVQQSVTFPAPPAVLYRMYLASAEHGIGPLTR